MPASAPGRPAQPTIPPAATADGGCKHPPYTPHPAVRSRRALPAARTEAGRSSPAGGFSESRRPAQGAFRADMYGAWGGSDHPPCAPESNCHAKSITWPHSHACEPPGAGAGRSTAVIPSLPCAPHPSCPEVAPAECRPRRGGPPCRQGGHPGPP